MVSNHADEIKNQFAQILSGEEYTAYYKEQENFFQQLLEKMANWLAEFLVKLIPWHGMSQNTFLSISYLLIVVILLVVLLFFFLFLRRYIMKKNENPSFIGSRNEFSMNRQAHLATAENYAEKGDYRQGIRYLFLALLLFLNEKEWLKARPWKTNGEYVDELMEVSPSFAQRFSLLAGMFDESFYGGRKTTREDYQKFYHLVNEWLGGKEG